MPNNDGSFENFEELVRRVRARDKAAEQFLKERYAPELRRSVNRVFSSKYRITLSPESVVQSALECIVVLIQDEKEQACDLTDSRQLWVLLVGIARSKLLQHIKGNERDRM